MTDTIQTKSMNGVVFVVGQTVLKAYVAGRTPLIEQRTVTLIENGRLYLDNSKVAINFPNRLWVL